MQNHSIYRYFGMVALVILALVVFTACAPAAPTSAPAATSAPVIQTVIVQGTPKVITATPGPTTAAPAATSAVTPTATVPPAPSIKNPDTLVEAVIGDPESLDPAWAYDTASGNIIQNVYEPLITYQRDSVDKFVGVLASDWKASTDGKTYTFTIRKGVKFQNGDPLTATDVAYSWVRGMIQSRDGGPQWIMLQPFFGPSVTAGFLDTAVKPGDKTGDDVVNSLFNGDFAAACNAAYSKIKVDDTAMTVTATLAQPWGPFIPSIATTWGSVVDKKWVGSQGGWNGDCSTAKTFNNPKAEDSKLFDKMNGTGPFKLTNWNKGNSITLDANPDYWLTQPLWTGGPTGPAKLKHVIIRTVPEWGTRFAMLTTGDADTADVPSNFRVQADPLVKEDCPQAGTGNCTPVNSKGFLTRYKGLVGLSQDTIFFNQKVNVVGGNSFVGSGKLDGNGITPTFFNDIHIRKAFAACFDYDTFIKQVRQGDGIVPNGPVIPGELGYDKSAPTQKFDLNTCKSEFDAAAKDPGLADISKGFFVAFVYNTGNANRQSAGQILAQNVAKVNPKFHISVVDEPWPVFLKDQTDSRLPLFMLGWLEDYHDPEDWVAPYLGTGGTYSGTQNFDPALQKQIDDLINKGLAETDQAARAKIYAQLNALSIDNALDIFVDTPVSSLYFQSWLHGFFFNPINNNGNQYLFYPMSKGQ